MAPLESLNERTTRLLYDETSTNIDNSTLQLARSDRRMSWRLFPGALSVPTFVMVEVGLLLCDEHAEEDTVVPM
jgi:hypothetical protein